MNYSIPQTGQLLYEAQRRTDGRRLLENPSESHPQVVIIDREPDLPVFQNMRRIIDGIVVSRCGAQEFVVTVPFRTFPFFSRGLLNMSIPVVRMYEERRRTHVDNRNTALPRRLYHPVVPARPAHGKRGKFGQKTGLLEHKAIGLARIPHCRMQMDIFQESVFPGRIGEVDRIVVVDIETPCHAKDILAVKTLYRLYEITGENYVRIEIAQRFVERNTTRLRECIVQQRCAEFVYGNPGPMKTAMLRAKRRDAAVVSEQNDLNLGGQFEPTGNRVCLMNGALAGKGFGD